MTRGAVLRACGAEGGAPKESCIYGRNTYHRTGAAPAATVILRKTGAADVAQAVCYSACGADLILGSAMQATLAGNSAVLVSCVNGKLLELLGETTFGRTSSGVWRGIRTLPRQRIRIVGPSIVELQAVA